MFLLLNLPVFTFFPLKGLAYTVTFTGPYTPAFTNLFFPCTRTPMMVLRHDAEQIDKTAGGLEAGGLSVFHKNVRVRTHPCCRVSTGEPAGRPLRN